MFESLAMLRKSGVVLLGSVVTDAYFQVSGAVVLMTLSLLLLAVLQPYKKKVGWVWVVGGGSWEEVAGRASVVSERASGRAGERAGERACERASGRATWVRSLTIALSFTYSRLVFHILMTAIPQIFNMLGEHAALPALLRALPLDG